MAAFPNGPAPDSDADEAAAEWLFRDEPKPADRPKPPAAAPAGESFDLADAPDPAPRRAPAPSFDLDDEPADEPPRAAKAARPERSRPTPPRERPAARRREGASAVDEVWTRGAEWGGSIAAVVGWALVVLFALWLCLSSELYAAALVALAVGGAVGLALLYPIVVTLERPVRMTPEQALRDYYGALSHHFPHYKRMWLLLANAGRTTPRFASYEGFRRYWKEKLRQLREGRVKGSTPLAFAVADFRSEKSGGKTEIDATWTIQVFVRGRREEGPIWSFPSSGGLVKGPDNMWYLEDGTLAERAPRGPAEGPEMA